MTTTPIRYFVREMTINDYPNLISIWNSTHGISVDEEDSRENMITFLNRNPGLSFVATVGNEIIGTIKGAQDGRRGYISHVAVLPAFRSLGIAKALFEHSLRGLRNQNIRKCNLYVLDSNPNALEFWKHNGWKVIEYDFRMLQRRM